MRTFNVTVSDGISTSRFALRAENRTEARRIAHIAHIGTGWDVVRVNPKK